MAKKKGIGKPSQPKFNAKKQKWRNKKDKEEEELQVVEVKDFAEEERDAKDSDDDEIDTRKMVLQQIKKKKKSGGFQSMGLSFPVYKGVMKKGYKVPTPIQRKAMPVIMNGGDVVAMARTGSGKTAAFLIPLFEKLQTHSAKAGARALILSPTRELALQTLKFIKELGRFTDLKAALVLGGDSFEGQFAAIHRNPDIIVATPGRFLHVIMEMDLKLSSVEYIVFDEADRLFEMGFAEQLHEVIHRLPDSRQTLLFSATLPRLLVDFAKAGLTEPTLIRLDVDTKISEQLKTVFLHCRADDKHAILLHLLQNVISPTEQTLVFAATKHHVEYIKELLLFSGISCSYVYSSLDQTARTINVSKFQHKKTMVMVVTDVAARGIDIPMLDNVINFHFPAKPKLFVHRVGRVARAGRFGTAYSLVSNDEVAHMLDLHLFLGRPVSIASKDSTKDDCDGLLGRVPQRIVDEEEGSLRTAHEQSHDLFSLQGVYSNAYKQYIRSRPSASSESVKRAKELVASTIAVHPLIGSFEDCSAAKQLQMLDEVRNFKSRQTIFEVGPTSKTSAHKVMKFKRQKHGSVIEKAKQRRLDHESTETWKKNYNPEGGDVDDTEVQSLFTTVIDFGDNKQQKTGSSKSFRDENYVPHRSADYYAEKGLGLELNTFEKAAAESVVDIKADDDCGTRKSKNIKKWDRKRKRFIGADEAKKKKIRTESGALIPATYKKDLYKNWIKKRKMDAPGTARDIDDEDGVGRKGKSGKFGKRGTALKGGKKGNIPRNNELKSKDQILKARKTKEQLVQRQKFGRDKNQKRKAMRGKR